MHLAEQGKVALLALKYRLRKFGRIPISMGTEMFNTCITPILLYCSQVWGYRNTYVLDKVFLGYLKQMLGVRITTSNCATYSETRVLPFSVSCQYNMVKYWIKLVNGDRARPDFKSFFFLKENIDANVKGNWAKEVKSVLDNCGLSYLWNYDHIDNVTAVLGLIHQRLQDQMQTQIMSDVCHSAKLYSFSQFKIVFGQEKYLHCILNFKHRQALSCMRLVSHDLEIEVGRRSSIPRHERICKLCSNGIEDEQHFLLVCDKLAQVRLQYLPLFYINNSSHYNYCKLMRTDDEEILRNLCKYTYYAQKERESILKNRI